MGERLITGGGHFLSRQDVGILKNVGLPEWVAADADDVVRAVCGRNGAMDKQESER